MKRLALLAVIIIAAVFVFLNTRSGATLYKWKDKKGQVHITDYPPPPEEVGLPTEEPEQPLFKEKRPEPEEPQVQEPVTTTEEVQVPPAVIPQKPKSPPQGVLKLPAPVKRPSTQVGPEVKKTPKHKPEAQRRPVLPPKRPQRPTLPSPKGPSPAQLMALLSLGGLFYMVLLVALSLLSYFYTSLTIHMIGKKRGVRYAWTVWIPIVGGIASLFVILASAGRPLWWAVFFVLPLAASFGAIYMPVLGLVSLILIIGLLILMVILWMDITRNLGLNKWLGLLVIVPLANVVFMGYLAFKPEPEGEVEINKKKMVLTALIVYVVLVVASAVAIQYLVMPYLQGIARTAITGQLQKQLTIPKAATMPSGRAKPRTLPTPQPMTPAAYDNALQRKAPAFREGPFTYAGPVVVRLDHFWDDPTSPHVWLKVRTPLFPNLQYSVVEVKINNVRSINGADLYDHNGMFEKAEAFHRVHLFVQANYAEGQRDIHLLKGTKQDMIKEISGRVILHLPLNLRMVELPATKGATVSSQGVTIKVEDITPLKVVLTLTGNAEVIKTIGLNPSGKEFSPTMTMTTTSGQSKKLEMSFPERPTKLKLVLQTGQHLKAYPFSLKVR